MRITRWRTEPYDASDCIGGRALGGKLAGRVGELILTTHPRAGRSAAFAKSEVTITGDRMSGTIDTNNGKIEFVKRKRSVQ